MPERWLGLVVGSDGIAAVDLEVPVFGPLTIQMQARWKLQEGARPAAYAVMSRRIADYVRENHVNHVVVKASAISRSTGIAHLEAAELRGVAAAAAHLGDSSVILLLRAQVSKTFGDRDTDEYLKDDTFWETEVTGKLAVTRREAAFLVLSQTRPRD